MKMLDSLGRCIDTFSIIENYRGIDVNTPEPCSYCEHLTYDCMSKDDPSCVAECYLISFPDRDLKPKWADADCSRFEVYDKARITTITE
jgi:hypothetical protein